MKRWELQFLLTSFHTTDLDQDPVIGITAVVMLVIEIHEVIKNSEMIIAAVDMVEIIAAVDMVEIIAAVDMVEIIAAVDMVEIIAAVDMVENEVEPIPNRRDKIRLVYSSS